MYHMCVRLTQWVYIWLRHICSCKQVIHITYALILSVDSKRVKANMRMSLYAFMRKRESEETRVSGERVRMYIFLTVESGGMPPGELISTTGKICFQYLFFAAFFSIIISEMLSVKFDKFFGFFVIKYMKMLYTKYFILLLLFYLNCKMWIVVPWKPWRFSFFCFISRVY